MPWEEARDMIGKSVQSPHANLHHLARQTARVSRRGWTDACNWFRQLKNSEPYTVGPPECGRARSTTMRHHSSSTLTYALFARRNCYEPTQHIACPRAHIGFQGRNWSIALIGCRGLMLQALSEKHNSFLRLLKKKGFKEESRTKVGVYAIGTSTTLESNKSLGEIPG